MSDIRKLDRQECWDYLGYITQYGYGSVFFEGFQFRAHRLSYELFVGEIPNGLTLDHLCRNKACINPYHLEAVTNKVNVLRGIGHCAINAKKTHCKHGHPLSGDNLWIVYTWRRCRECSRLRSIKKRCVKSHGAECRCYVRKGGGYWTT